MKRKRTYMRFVVLGISVIFMVNATNFSLGLSGTSAQKPSNPANTPHLNQLNQPELKKEPQNTQPALPPNNDAEMIVNPDVPLNPEAVVTPPVVDPEMVVDPTTRQPMTEEKLEHLTPEELEKNTPDEK